MVTTLANKAFSYLVITIDNTVPLMTDQDPFTYNATIFISHYTVDNFIGIMIDIGVSKQSIARYGQFLAFQRLNTGIQLNITIQGIINVQFSIGSTLLIRSAKITTLI